MKIINSLLLLLIPSSVMADDLQTLKSVADFAKGAAEARSARDTLVSGGAANLLPVLKAFRDSSPLAGNWLRSTFEAIADAEEKAGRSLPRGELVAFIKDRSESPNARRLAYEWLKKRSPELEAELIPEMLLDPSPEFRRDAVDRLVKEAGTIQGEGAVAIFRKAMQGAVHEDQVKTISKALRDAGETVDIQRHFGFLSKWQIIGPFDNKEMKGFPIAYPPEMELNLSAEYDGQLGKVKWQPISTDEDYGVVDIGKQISNYKGSLMYVTTTYNSEKEQSLEMRLGTPNAWKLWVNGQLMFEREEYHRSTSMDQYRVPVALKVGSNTLLLKVCQNEQDQSWAQDYKFQLRICDSTGSAVLGSEKSVASSARKEIQ